MGKVNKKQPRIVAIIQARMGASRLPGKVLMDIAGKPMLAWVIERARQSKRIDEIVVATTKEPADEAIAQLCSSKGIRFFRGSTYDVLDRYYQAAKYFQADVIVRLTADCPLLDPEVIDLTISELVNRSLDFATNRLPPPWKGHILLVWMWKWSVSMPSSEPGRKQRNHLSGNMFSLIYTMKMGDSRSRY